MGDGKNEIRFSVFSATIVFWAVTAVVQADWLSQPKLAAPDPLMAASFGCSVGISGDYIIVGAENDDDNGIEAGSAYIFKRSGETWAYQRKLLDGSSDYTHFGCSVAISGNYAIVGARNDDENGSQAGAAYIFKRSGTNWNFQAKLLDDEGASFDHFGFSVSIRGDYCIVGSPGDGANKGSACIFVRDGSGWTQQARLTDDDGANNDWFAKSVAISANHAIAGSHGDGSTDKGSACVFVRDGVSWSKQDKITAGDSSSYDRFGTSVAIDANSVFVGAINEDQQAPNAGAVYVFGLNDPGWEQQQKLTASDGQNGDNFGNSVSVSGEYAIIGAYYEDQGTTSATGAAYIFKLEDGTWNQQLKLTDPGGETNDYFGISVSIDTGYAIAGAENNDGGDGVDSGTASVFGEPGALNLLDPDGAEYLRVSVSYDILWQTEWFISNVLVEYSIDEGENFTTIDSVDNTGLYQWLVPEVDSNQCLIRISDPCHPTISDVSSAPFSIYQGSLTLVDPNGGEDLLAGEDYEISWQTNQTIYDVLIEYSTNNGGSWTEIAAVTNTGSYLWTVPQLNSQQCLVQISDFYYPEFYDQSNAAFTIYTGRLMVTDPNGGEEVLADSVYEIGWETQGDVCDVSIEYSANNGGDWIAVETVENLGYYLWDVPHINSEQCLIRLRDSEYTSVVDVSDNVFAVYIRTLTVLDPNGGEYLLAGNDYDILWQSEGDMPNVLIEYSIDNGGEFIAIENVDNTGLYQWLVPEVDSNQCVIKISDPCWPDVNGVSEDVFTIHICSLIADFDSDCFVDWYDLDIFTGQWAGRTETGWIQDAKLSAFDPGSGDYFGQSVSISGDYAIIGANYDNDKGNDSGSAYIFDYNDAGWGEIAKLTASNGLAYDGFGESVSISGDYAIVGSPYNDNNGNNNSGSAYIFEHNGQEWTEQIILSPNDPESGDNFGFSVAIDGNYAIVGALHDDNDGDADSGSAYIFYRGGSGWQQQAKITADDAAAGNYFGFSVAISGDYAIIGGIYSSGAYIFKRQGTSWLQQQKFITSYSGIGTAVAISENYAIASDCGDDDNGVNAGAVYIFRRDGLSWVEEQKITASDGGEGDNFGTAISLTTNYAAISTKSNGSIPGAVYVFERGESLWYEYDKLSIDRGKVFDYFGSAVAADANNFIVGSKGDDSEGVNNAGAAYIYTDLCPSSDLNGDCFVDFLDFAVLADQWMQ